jgi:hypothetical protein
MIKQAQNPVNSLPSAITHDWRHGLIEVGNTLDEEFLGAQATRLLAREEKARLKGLKIEEGIVEKLASRTAWQEFIERR